MSPRCLLFVCFAAVLSAQTTATLTKTVDTYCAGCHNGSMRSPSNQLLPQFDTARIAGDATAWSNAYREMQAGTMPPVGAPRPNRATYDAVLADFDKVLISNLPAPAPPTSRELATRLAQLLWNSEPDAALLADAQSGRLNDAATLDRQIRRMLADDRAQALIENFFVPWLQLDKLANAKRDKEAFPDYDPSLRDAFLKETELFLLSQLRDDRDPVELWSANYTFVNEQLARQYGLAQVSGPDFRRIAWTTPERAGLLGQGSVQMATSPLGNPFTSPAARGRWILAHFLGVPPPRPAPNAKPVDPKLPITPQTRALPQDPCVTCHRNFFPLGYALENFGPLGSWRTQDQIGPVDASAAMVDGAPANGVVELRAALLERPEAFRTTITERLLTYASTGKAAPLDGTPETLARARQILSGMQQPRWSTIIASVVRTERLAKE